VFGQHGLEERPAIAEDRGDRPATVVPPVVQDTERSAVDRSCADADHPEAEQAEPQLVGGLSAERAHEAVSGRCGVVAGPSRDPQRQDARLAGSRSGQHAEHRIIGHDSLPLPGSQARRQGLFERVDPFWFGRAGLDAHRSPP
jgi:hypothetical protein